MNITVMYYIAIAPVRNHSVRNQSVSIVSIVQCIVRQAPERVHGEGAVQCRRDVAQASSVDESLQAHHTDSQVHKRRPIRAVEGAQRARRCTPYIPLRSLCVHFEFPLASLRICLSLVHPSWCSLL